MTQPITDNEAALAALEQARDSLAKLPILGPALWLYARDPARKFMFVGDMDWALLPPVVLDQCRLYSKNGLPYAFFTWAKVSEQIDARLRGSQPRLAPHEWQSGEHVWIIDAVAPFGQLEEALADLIAQHLKGVKVSILLPNPNRPGEQQIREWPGQQH
jgi:cytolysin-activating lysine-acyltransferase